ncbi:hypothetical protein TgHK011_008419 [Trichoderma gracile]|nr:hypothetical protein TgHK011_008419 [Trichoderma gracile]
MEPTLEGTRAEMRSLRASYMYSPGPLALAGMSKFPGTDRAMRAKGTGKVQVPQPRPVPTELPTKSKQRSRGSDIILLVPAPHLHEAFSFAWPFVVWLYLSSLSVTLMHFRPIERRPSIEYIS